MKERTPSDIAFIRALSGNSDRPAGRYPSGRVCTHHDCGTHVSIYNEDPYCSLHMQGVVPTLRGKRNVDP